MIATTVALRNPERAPEHESLENPIPALKKEPWNGSLRQKTFSNGSDTGLPFSWRNTIENGASVTTSHVLLPNERRNIASLLPIWLRNSGFSGRTYCYESIGGAGATARSRQHTSIHKVTRNFMAKECPALLSRTKICPATSVHFTARFNNEHQSLQ